mmetsp:Transcript_57323/g.166379  ORF Transcript_57323/g.166379 Transcript_57323/m.166379 type:complete len:226 (-) Transcript_57323:331-1008(-)
MGPGHIEARVDLLGGEDLLPRESGAHLHLLLPLVDADLRLPHRGVERAGGCAVETRPDARGHTRVGHADVGLPAAGGVLLRLLRLHRVHSAAGLASRIPRLGRGRRDVLRAHAGDRLLQLGAPHGLALPGEHGVHRGLGRNLAGACPALFGGAAIQRGVGREGAALGPRLRAARPHGDLRPRHSALHLRRPRRRRGGCLPRAAHRRAAVVGLGAFRHRGHHDHRD